MMTRRRGRESSVRALEEVYHRLRDLSGHPARTPPSTSPRPTTFFRSDHRQHRADLKLPDGNIKVLVEGIERGKILGVTETDGYLQATVRVARYATRPHPRSKPACSASLACSSNM